MSTSTASTREDEPTTVRRSRKHVTGHNTDTSRQLSTATTARSLRMMLLIMITSCIVASPAVAHSQDAAIAADDGNISNVSKDGVLSSPEDTLAELFKKPSRLASVVPLVLGLRLFWHNRRRMSVTKNVALVALPTGAIILLMWQLPWLFSMIKLFFWAIELLVGLMISIVQFAFDRV